MVLWTLKWKQNLRNLRRCPEDALSWPRRDQEEHRQKLPPQGTGHPHLPNLPMFVLWLISSRLSSGKGRNTGVSNCTSLVKHFGLGSLNWKMEIRSSPAPFSSLSYWHFLVWACQLSWTQISSFLPETMCVCWGAGRGCWREGGKAGCLSAVDLVTFLLCDFRQWLSLWISAFLWSKRGDSFVPHGVAVSHWWDAECQLSTYWVLIMCVLFILTLVNTNISPDFSVLDGEGGSQYNANRFQVLLTGVLRGKYLF